MQAMDIRETLLTMYNKVLHGFFKIGVYFKTKIMLDEKEEMLSLLHIPSIQWIIYKISELNYILVFS